MNTIPTDSQKSAISGFVGAFRTFVIGCFILLVLFVLFIGIVIFFSSRSEKKLPSPRTEYKGRRISQDGRVRKTPIKTPRSQTSAMKSVDIPGIPQTPSKSLTDAVFGVTVPNTLRLKRVVEMCQWKETVTVIPPRGSSRMTTYKYDYSYEWSEQKIDSKSFNDRSRKNPEEWPFMSKIFNADDVTLGDVKIISSQLQKFDYWKPVPFSEIKNLPENSSIEGNDLYIKAAKARTDTVGDMKVRFFKIPIGPIRVKGKQIDDRIKIEDLYVQ